MPSDRIEHEDHDARMARKGGNPLQRGSACLSCRKRKMKCDATKPTCRQCVKANRAEECEYDDGRQKSRTQILQEKISKLESRILELEGEEGVVDALEANQLAGMFGGDQGYADVAGLDLSMETGIGMSMQLGAYGFSEHAGHTHQSHSLSPVASGSGSGSGPASASGSGTGSGAISFSPLALGASALPGSSYPMPAPTLPSQPSQSQMYANTHDSLFFGLPASSSGHSPHSSGSGSREGSQWAAQHGMEMGMGMEMFGASTSSFGMNPGMAMGVEQATLFDNGMPDLSTAAALASGSSIPASGSGTFMGLRASSGKSWEAEELQPAQRKMLLEIFLPHAQQCGLDVSPERLYQRLDLDFSKTFQLYQQNQLQKTNSDELRAPPAHPAFANALFLLSCHFSSVHAAAGAEGATDLSAHEPHFLTRALRGIAAALEAGEAATSDTSSSASTSSSPARSSHPSPTSSSSSSSSSAFVPALPTSSTSADETEEEAGTPLVDAVQASALLAVYFFGKARLLEGYYHASAAARLAVALGMHQISSAVWRPPAASASASPQLEPESSSSAYSSAFPFSGPPSSGVMAGAGSWAGTPAPAVALPTARSARAHADRVSAFWSVFIVDRCWSVATGLPSSLPDDEHPQLRICTVWPWNADVEVTRENADYTSLGSLYDPDFTIAPTSTSRCTKALKAKAAAFFERAARIASMQAEPTQWEQLTQLEFALMHFMASLPSYVVVSSSVPTSAYAAAAPTHVDLELALVHTLTHGATIQMHHPRAQADVHAHTACVRSAAAVTSIVRQLSDADFALLDPVIGTCWMCVSDVLLRERMWGGNMESARDVSGVVPCFGVEAELDIIVTALRRLSFIFPVALYQAQKVEQSRNTPF
ncbi:hypothetical protein DFH11DRAFT_250715 [Phellopilus nigrolimitatus]|nr:hypothetical protein DFH11DRAFT_250715 [Phellopilus nigrolimitatus]